MESQSCSLSDKEIKQADIHILGIWVTDINDCHWGILADQLLITALFINSL